MLHIILKLFASLRLLFRLFGLFFSIFGFLFIWILLTLLVYLLSLWTSFALLFVLFFILFSWTYFCILFLRLGWSWLPTLFNYLIGFLVGLWFCDFLFICTRLFLISTCSLVFDLIFLSSRTFLSYFKIVHVTLALFCLSTASFRVRFSFLSFWFFHRFNHLVNYNFFVLVVHFLGDGIVINWIL